MIKREQKLRQDLCSGPFLPKIISYAVPIILTSVLQLLFNAADLVVVGQFEGNNDLGAVGATGALITLLISLFTGLSVGAGVCVAQAIGSRDNDRISRAVHTAIPAAAIGGGMLTVVGVAFAPQMLALMDTPDTVMDLAVVYMRIYFGGVISLVVYNFGAAILRSAGDTKSPLIYLSVSGVVNVALNLFFVVVCHMSVAGVALATVLSQTLSCVLVLRALLRRTDACRLNVRKMRIDPISLRRIIAIGLPAGIQSSLFAVANVVIQSSINSFGEVVLSGSTAASNIEGFVYMSMEAFQQTATTFSGQNAGARRYDNVRRITFLCVACVTAVGVALGGGCYLFAPHLLSLYLKEGGDAIMYGVTRMTYVCLPYFLCGIMNVLSGVMRGMGSSVTPMILSLLGACGLRLIWVATVFRLDPTMDMLFMCFPVSWIVTLVALVVAYAVVLKKRIKNRGA